MIHRNLKELLSDDYIDLDENNYNDSQDDISVSLDNERQISFNLTNDKKVSRDYLSQIFYHPVYDYFMALITVSSSLTLGLSLETDVYNANNHYFQQFIFAFDEVIIAIFFVEFTLKLYLKSNNSWFSWTTIYDFTVILFSIIEIIWNLSFLNTNSIISNLLKGFRLLQLLRVYRIIKLSEGLQVLIRALMKTILTYTFTVLILVFIFVYVIAIIGQILYGKSEDR